MEQDSSARDGVGRPDDHDDHIVLLAHLERTRDRLATVLGTITDGVTAHDRDGRLAFANDAAARLCGLESAEEMLRLPGREILRRFEIRDEAGELVPRDDLPFRRAQATLAPSQALLHLRQVASGEESWTLISSTAVSDTAGELIVTVYTDLTGQKRSEEAWRFLADASAVLGRSVAFETTFLEVVGLAVPRVADHCSIHRLAAGGRVELVAAAGGSAGRPAGEQVARVLAGGPAVLQDSSILVPIVARGRVFGSFGLACAESRRRFAAPDLTLAEEVARRAGLAIEAARAYREVRQAVRMRDNFLSVASHELKTPLSSLTLLVSALARTARQGRLPEMPIERLRDRLVRIEEQADRLTDLINQLLDVSRLSSGRISLSLGLTDLTAVSTEVVSRFAEEAARAGSSVSLESDGALMGVWDRSRIDQVITNLLSNAIKYGAGSAVVLSLASEGEGARLTVRDGGPGVAEADQARIFEQYERGPTTGNQFETEMNGLGLGLWIARQLVEAHRGRIGLESRPTGGASFTVWLPRRGTTP
jgi:signal transduction histidine kinase